MRVLLAPHGTRGDIQPKLALADALARRGHAVRFVAPANFVPWIAARGFEARSDGIDVERLFRTVGANFQSFRWQAEYLSRVLTPQLFESVAAASEDVDLIVGAGVQTAGSSIAEWRDVPYCSAAFCPCAIPSRDAPPPSVKTQTLPKWVNGLLWQAGRPVTNLLLRKSINTGRARLALEPIDSVLEQFAGSAIIAARALGRRAIVACGWAGLNRYVPDDEDVCVVDAAPHDLVLPHVAAAVHHGGAGTTTAAARAGVPQVVLPHLLDQFYWAHRVESLSLGPAGLAVEIANAEILTARISTALTDHRMRGTAAAFGPRVAARNGVQAAADILENVAGRRVLDRMLPRSPS